MTTATASVRQQIIEWAQAAAVEMHAVHAPAAPTSMLNLIDRAAERGVGHSLRAGADTARHAYLSVWLFLPGNPPDTDQVLATWHTRATDGQRYQLFSCLAGSGAAARTMSLKAVRDLIDAYESDGTKVKIGTDHPAHPSYGALRAG